MKSALNAAGVSGTEDLGRFVNNTKYFEPSNFDVRAAIPVLLDILPSLTDRQTAMTVAMYLQEPIVESTAFGILREAFVFWAPKEQTGVGWQLGIAVVRAADRGDLPALLNLAQRTEFGIARQMIVDSLWRWRTDPTVAPTLARLCEDPDVCLHAMSAYRRTVGNANAIKLLVLLESHADPKVQRQASRARLKAEKAVRAAK